VKINSRIYVAGHRGLVGSAIYRLLKKRGFENLITRTHSELELMQFRIFLRKQNLNLFFSLQQK